MPASQGPVPDPISLLERLFQAAVQRAMPEHCLGPFLPAPPKGRTLVLGAGKAGGAMAAAVDQLWPQDAPISGLVVTRYQHIPPAYRDRQSQGQARIEVVEAAHPVPDEAGRRAAPRILAAASARSASRRTSPAVRSCPARSTRRNARR